MLKNFSRTLSRWNFVQRGRVARFVSQAPVIARRNLSSKKTQKTEAKLSFEEESDLYVLGEVISSIEKYNAENKRVTEVVEQFKHAFLLNGIEIVKAPVPGLESTKTDILHFSKSVDGTTKIDLIVDFKKVFNEDAREIQVVITDETKVSQLFYLMGDFSREDGMLFSNSMMIDSLEYNKTAVELRDAICDGEAWVFRMLNNKFQKTLDVRNVNVVKFLLNIKRDAGEALDSLDSRTFVDALINYTVLTHLGVLKGHDEGDKLCSIFWLFGNYCENTLYGRWLQDMMCFLKR